MRFAIVSAVPILPSAKAGGRVLGDGPVEERDGESRGLPLGGFPSSIVPGGSPACLWARGFSVELRPRIFGNTKGGRMMSPRRRKDDPSYSRRRSRLDRTFFPPWNPTYRAEQPEMLER